MKSVLRLCYRATGLGAYFGLGLMQILYLRWRYGASWHTQPIGEASIVRWMCRVATLLGLRIHQYNRLRRRSTLFVANHISFLDIVVISAIVPTRFISKHTVDYWPIIGLISRLSGTLYIRRGKRSLIHRTVDTLMQALQQPRPVLIFPEGTTGLGDHVKKFHTGLFQAAIDSQTTVQALALRYRRNGQLDRLAAYIDNDNFFLTLGRIMAQTHTEVEIHGCTPVAVTGFNRQTLAHWARQQIEQALLH